MSGIAAERYEAMSIKFEKGQTYNTFKTLGVMKKEDGRFQISQRLGKDGPDILPTENLTFDGRDNGKLWFVREDGTRVCGHKSHFDAEDAYNLAKDGAKGVEAIKTKVAKKQAELEEAAAQLEALLKEEEAIQAEGASVVSDEARDEAAALFNEA